MKQPPVRRPAPSPSPLRELPLEFIGSFPDFQVQLDPPLPEVAFLGRSNVGKSTLLNALVGRPGAARVSATPGKTTTLNVFRLPLFYLVDLPGYGFALASKSAREDYLRLLSGYLERRERLTGIVWLLDIRRTPSAEDLGFREVLARRDIPVLVALTKADKLGRGAQQAQVRELAAMLELAEDQVQLTSSTTGAGIAELGQSVLALLTKEAA